MQFGASHHAELTRIAWSDLRYAVRSLRRAGGTVAAVVVTLAIGLGVTAATFSMLDQLFWRPPAGVADAREIHRVWFHQRERWDGELRARVTSGVPQLTEVRDVLAGVSDVGLYVADTAWRLGASAARVRVGFANREFFEVLRVAPARGRLFDDSENSITTPAAVAVVSGRFAARWLSGPELVGSVVELQGRQYTVIGVMPDDVTGLDLQPTDVWLPLGSYRDDERMNGVAPWYRRTSLARGVVRLPGDAPVASLSRRATERVRAFHRERGFGDTLLTVSFAPAVGVRGPAEAQPEVIVATRVGIVGVIILLIACANVANLFLARATRRRREFGIRGALGISRTRLIALLSLESAVIGLVTALLAALVTWWCGEALRALLFPGLTLADSVLHWRVALLALALAFGTSWAVSVIPTVHLAGAGLGSAGAQLLRVTSATTERRTARLRTMLTVAQVSFSLVLLTAAAAFIVSLRKIQAHDIGFDVAHTMSAEVSFEERSARPTDHVLAATMRRARARVAEMPGVEHVALSLAGPMSGAWAYVGWYAQTDSSRRDTEPDTWPVTFIVEPGFFDATGLAVVRGRTFADAPRGGRVGEAVVNMAMARRGWQGGKALGECIYIEERSNPCTRVVGIAENSPRSEVLEGNRPIIFLPLAEWEAKGWLPSTLVARVRPNAQAAVVTELRRILRQDLPTGTPRVSSLEGALAPQFRQWRLGATLFTGFAVLALLVSGAGVYATTAYAVAQRSREFGIRIALGATRGHVLGTVFRRVAVALSIGMLVGIAGTLTVGRVIQGLLFDVSAHDPVIVGAAALVLATAGCIAAFGPALRASRESPLSVMRED